MSSYYDAICLSHDPAIVMGHDESSWDAAIERGRLEHPRCDLLVGRWSGALVEVGCPGMSPDADVCQRHGGGWHRDLVIADARLLHVAAVVAQHAENDVALEAAARQLRMCWTPERLCRISAALGVEGAL